MTASTGPGSRPLRSYLSDVFGRLLPPFFDRELPPERRATCDDCAMCGASTPDDDRARTRLNPDTKCCTYHPALPNFAVGALLSDERVDVQEGRRRLLARIGEQHGIFPSGVEGPPGYWLHYSGGPGVFGRSEKLLCPFYDRGRCTVWQVREAVCATYFCKYDRGEEGLQFWQALRDYLRELSGALVVHALMELGFTGRQALAPADTLVTPEELDRRPLPNHVYAARWGRWAGREAELFREAHALVSRLGLQQIEALGGARVRARLAQVEACYAAMVEPQVPARLRRNPRLYVTHEAGALVVQGYSPMDPSRVSPVLYATLEAFDGREHGAIIAELKAAGRAFPSPELLRQLYHHRILEEA